MIRNEAEYKEAVDRLREEGGQLDQHRRSLAEQGFFQGDALQRLMDPLLSFHLQLQEEVQSYERLKRGEMASLVTS